jgi:hypothetical protein
METRTCAKCGALRPASGDTCVQCGTPFADSPEQSAIAYGSAAVGRPRSGLAVGACVLASSSLVGWLLPPFGFTLALLGIVLASLARREGSSRLATVSLVLGCVGLAATVVNSAIGAWIGYHGMLK